VIPTTANDNWHVEPQEAVEALRAAALEQEAETAIAPCRSISARLLSKAEHARNAVGGN
jgi:hypothetical protein